MEESTLRADSAVFVFCTTETDVGKQDDPVQHMKRYNERLGRHKDIRKFCNAKFFLMASGIQHPASGDQNLVAGRRSLLQNPKPLDEGFLIGFPQGKAVLAHMDLLCGGIDGIDQLELGGIALMDLDKKGGGQ